jgi:predicted heme/steroid binding protein
MAIKTLRVFQEFTSEGYVPMPIAGNIDYGVTVAGTFPGTTPATYQTDDPDIDVEVTVMTDFYVWIRSHGAEWNINYTRNVRVYPDSALINNVVMGIIIAGSQNGLPVGGTAGQILSKIDADNYNAEWIDNILDNLKDVVIATPTNNQGLVYETSTLLWKNKAIQLPITLTTTGSSGASTFVGNALNIPTYTLVGLGGVPTTRTLSINGTSFDLSANRSWSVGTVTLVSATVPTGFAISGSPITTTGTLALSFASGYSLPTDAKQAQWDVAYNKRIDSFIYPIEFQSNIISIYQSSPTSSGYLSSADYITFNSKQSALNGTGFVKANGTSISYDNSTYVPTSRTITINGTTFDLSANRTWTVGDTLTASSPLSITSGVISITQASASVNGYLSSTDWATFNDKQTALSGTGFVKVSGTTVSYDNTAYTPAARLLTINGTTYDLTADRAWTITSGSGMRNVQTFTATANQTTFTITGGYTVGLVDVYVNGARLSTSDYTASNGTTVVLGVGVVANDIVDFVSYTSSLSSGINGSGTTNYISKFTASNVLGNSLIFDDGTNVGIGNASPTAKLHVTGNILASSTITASSLIKSGGTSAQILAADGSVITAGTNITISGGVISSSGGGGGGLTGTGTTNYISKWTSSTALGNSLIFDNGTSVGIGTTSPSRPLEVYGADNLLTSQVRIKSFGSIGGRTLHLGHFGSTSYITNAGCFNNGWVADNASTAMSGIFMDSISGDSNISFYTSATNNSAPISRMSIRGNGVINLVNVPTSSSGLTSGDIYRIGGALMIV